MTLLKKLIDDKEYAQSQGAVARLRVLKECSWANTWKNYLRLSKHIKVSLTTFYSLNSLFSKIWEFLQVWNLHDGIYLHTIL